MCVNAHTDTASKCIYCETEKLTKYVNTTERDKNSEDKSFYATIYKADKLAHIL